MATSNTYEPNAPTYPSAGSTGSAAGNREDLTGILTILAPEETPITSLCPKTKAVSTFVEWNVDSLADVNTTGEREGADVSAFVDKFSGRARLGNYIQKFRRAYKVSDLQEAVDSVGPARIAQAQAKSLRELKRDLEATICSDNNRTIEDGGDSPGTPYGMRGLGSWLDDGVTNSDIPDAYKTPTSSILDAVPTEQDFNGLIASVFGVTGETKSLTLVAGIALRQAISNFTRTAGAAEENVYRVTQSAESKKVTLSVTMFDSDFGMVKMVNGNPACLDSEKGFLIDPARLGVASLIPLRTMRLEDQGGGPRGYAELTCTLLMKHPQAHGKIDYTT